MKKIILFAILIILLGSFFPTFFKTSAQQGTEPVRQYRLIEAIPGLKKGEAVSLPQYLSTLYRAGVVFAAMLAVLMIIVGGLQYMTTAVGNVSKVASAKAQIWSAILGLFLVLASYLVLYTINPNLISMRIGVTTLNPYRETGSEPPDSEPSGYTAVVRCPDPYRDYEVTRPSCFEAYRFLMERCQGECNESCSVRSCDPIY